MTQSTVTKTAYDALTAKWSALSAGHDVVDANSEIYGDLLKTLAARRVGPPRRQTPLVNAGYAARISITTHAVQKFIQYHAEHTTPRQVQLVCLGCGLDAVGLWAHSLLPAAVRVFELDASEIVVEKRDSLISSGLIKPVGGLLDSGELELRGRINGPETYASASNDSESNYALLSCDLRKPDQVRAALSSLDPYSPTLVLSELVFVYLGRSGLDNILELCATELCIAPGSALVAYEPLGAGSANDVVNSYKHDYCRLFREKLQRGRASTSPLGDATDEQVFHPLGDSTELVENRFEAAGFPFAYACLAGTAAAYARSASARLMGTMESPEPFDEHAAFTLHMHSYTLGCAFSNGTSRMLKTSMCPWSSASVFALSTLSNENATTSIGPLRKDDQRQVADLFCSTYEKLAEKYPAVRRMVKTALKTDLSFSTEPSFWFIGSTYKTKGGIFVVATETVAEKNNDEVTRRVIGCVGLSRCQGIRGSSRLPTFEIHRLAVDPECRGKGIGKALLETLDRFVRWKLNSDEYRVLATTPALLSSANQLYKSCGYTLEKEEKMGELSMCTYAKGDKSY